MCKNFKSLGEGVCYKDRESNNSIKSECCLIYLDRTTHFQSHLAI